MKRKTFNIVPGTNAGITVLAMAFILPLARAQDATGTKAEPSKEAIHDVQQLKEKQVVIATGKEDWSDTTGFGKDADMASMMTLMMVGGSGMEHMKMGAMKPGMKMDNRSMPGMTQGLPVVVTLVQNPPVVGNNTLDVLVTDAGGKPMPGLNLAAEVAMASMDMGTAKPEVTEGKDGHYSVTVNFSMKGPWKVLLKSDNKNKARTIHSALNFKVDGKTKWEMPTSPVKTQEGVEMSDMKTAGTPAEKMPDTTAQNSPPSESAPKKLEPPVPAMPLIAATSEKKIPVTESAPASTQSAAKLADKPSAEYKIMLNTAIKSMKVGKNMLDVTILDPSGKPVTGAKVTASVEMTSMDMGITKPTTKESKNGHYATSVQFMMRGPWRVTMTVAPPKQKPFTKAFDFTVSP